MVSSLSMAHFCDVIFLIAVRLCSHYKVEKKKEREYPSCAHAPRVLSVLPCGIAASSVVDTAICS